MRVSSESTEWYSSETGEFLSVGYVQDMISDYAQDANPEWDYLEINAAELRVRWTHPLPGTPDRVVIYKLVSVDS